MRNKITAAVIGTLISVAIAAPVVQAVQNRGGNPSNPRNGTNPFPQGTSVSYYFGTPAANEIFANWVYRAKNALLTFGANNVTSTDFVGLRVDTNNSVTANNWSMDVNTTNGNSPYFETFIFESGSSTPELWSLVGANSLSTNYTSTTLTNGYRRVKYNALADTPTNSKFAQIYFADVADTGVSFQDSVQNVTVNGVPMIPNIQASPTFDCSLDFR